jgi:hypothetical protein
MKQKLQPFVITVGQNVQSSSQYFTYVCESTMYEFDNLLQAVDICFKCIMVLNLNYPVECAPMWSFIQKGIYNIRSNRDKYFESAQRLQRAVEKTN